ncbi:hypothetical protein QOZ80_2AG0139970 [Eleusine coracana subsp. coracana]|nr:hypothetical protein QOZ80_2AG0139970 [Eleusine coracana subsp. coracana]
MSNTLLRIYPSELKMPLELRKQNSSCMELFNKTDERVAFKVKTTNPNKYAVRPASGIVQPGQSCGIRVTMRAPKEMPADYQCKDKFLVQSTVVEDEATQKDIVPDMFRKAPGKIVEEFKMRMWTMKWKSHPRPMLHQSMNIHLDRNLIMRMSL